jgi:hypothetical protein
MVLAAAVALVVAAWREDSRRTVGVVLILGCVACLTYKLTTDRLVIRKAEGVGTSHPQRVIIVSVSAATAVAVLGASDVAFLVVYWGYMLTIRILAAVDHFWPWEEPEHILIGTVLGGVAALRMVSLTTRLIRLLAARSVAGHSLYSAETSFLGVEISPEPSVIYRS